MEEAERLANNGDYKERLTTVKKLLEESKVAKFIYDLSIYELTKASFT